MDAPDCVKQRHSVTLRALLIWRDLVKRTSFPIAAGSRHRSCTSLYPRAARPRRGRHRRRFFILIIRGLGTAREYYVGNGLTLRSLIRLCGAPSHNLQASQARTCSPARAPLAWHGRSWDLSKPGEWAYASGRSRVIAAQRKPANSRATATVATPVGLWRCTSFQYTRCKRRWACQAHAITSGAWPACRAFNAVPIRGGCSVTQAASINS